MLFVIELPGLPDAEKDHVAEVIYQALEEAGYDSVARGTVLPQYEPLLPYLTGQENTSV